jgi:FtsZ-binding cell division protein ZapB
MSKIDDLLDQVETAAKQLLDTIQDLDAMIAELQEKRQRIGEAPVSKVDFLRYIEKALDENAKNIGRNLARQFDTLDRSFFALENSRINIPFLTGGIYPVAITEDAAYWYLKPAIMARMEELADNMDFPADTVPVNERRRLVGAIDVEIKQLFSERDDLAAHMETAGLVG